MYGNHRQDPSAKSDYEKIIQKHCVRIQWERMTAHLKRDREREIICEKLYKSTSKFTSFLTKRNEF